MLKGFAKEFAASDYDQRLQMALRKGNAKGLFLDSEIVRQHNHEFSHRLASRAEPMPDNQGGTGRCWLYAANNAARIAAASALNIDSTLQTHTPGLEYSNVYLWFYHLLEGANTFFARAIDSAGADERDPLVNRIFGSPSEQGGTFPDFQMLIEKYGQVPKEVMPDTHITQNYETFGPIFDTKLRLGAAALRLSMRSPRHEAEDDVALHRRRTALASSVKDEYLAEAYRL